MSRVGTSGSYLVWPEEHAAPPGGVRLSHGRIGWARWQLRWLAEDDLITAAGDGPVVCGTVSYSDSALVIGRCGGKTRWRWIYGEWSYADMVGQRPLPDWEELEETLPARAAATAADITAWCREAGLPEPSGPRLLAALQVGTVFAEDSMIELLDAIGLVDPDNADPDEPAPGMQVPTFPRTPPRAAAIDHSSPEWRELLESEEGLRLYGEPPAVVHRGDGLYLASEPPVSVRWQPERLTWVDIPAEHAGSFEAELAWARANLGRQGAPPSPDRRPTVIERQVWSGGAPRWQLYELDHRESVEHWYAIELWTYHDLLTSTDAVAGWLDKVRQRLLEPVVEAYVAAGGTVRYGADDIPDDDDPPSLDISASMETATGRSTFAKADGPSWRRTLDRLRRGDLHRIELEASAQGEPALNEPHGLNAMVILRQPSDSTEEEAYLSMDLSPSVVERAGLDTVISLTMDAAIAFDAAGGYLDRNGGMSPGYEQSGYEGHVGVRRLLGGPRLDRICRGPAWLMLLGPGHVERLGGVDAAAAAYPFHQVARLGPLTLLQASEHPDQLRRTDYPALARALGPIMPTPADYGGRY
jgi:hypothetical protein